MKPFELARTKGKNGNNTLNSTHGSEHETNSSHLGRTANSNAPVSFSNLLCQFELTRVGIVFRTHICGGFAYLTGFLLSKIKRFNIPSYKNTQSPCFIFQTDKQN